MVASVSGHSDCSFAPAASHLIVSKRSHGMHFSVTAIDSSTAQICRDEIANGTRP